MEGLQWLSGPGAPVKITGKSGNSQARARLGYEAMRRLHDDVIRPIATRDTKGGWFKGWRLVSLDGSAFDVADDPAIVPRPAGDRSRRECLPANPHRLLGGEWNACAVRNPDGRPNHQRSGPDQGCPLRSGQGRRTATSSATPCGNTPAPQRPTWSGGSSRTARLKDEERLPDGSYLSHIYPSDKVRRKQINGIKIRVIDCRLDALADTQALYRLVPTILDYTQASAQELAAPYHERWEMETALDEIKTLLRGAKIVLRGKTHDLVRQDLYGLLMAHFAIRGLMHEAALTADLDPGSLSFLHAVRVIRSKIFASGGVPSSEQVLAA